MTATPIFWGLGSAWSWWNFNEEGKVKMKYFWTPEQDELIRKRYDSQTSTINDLVDIFKVPRWAVHQRAIALEVARTYDFRGWTPEQVAFLEKHYGRKSSRWLGKKLGRTPMAVMLKKKRLGLRKTADGYTLRMLCEGLGCDHHKVAKWESEGWIKSRPLGIYHPTSEYRYFTDDAIRKFIRRHPEQIDLKRVEKMWFIDVLAGLDNHVQEFEGSDKAIDEDEEKAATG